VLRCIRSSAAAGPVVAQRAQQQVTCTCCATCCCYWGEAAGMYLAVCVPLSLRYARVFWHSRALQ
jgi:hypothetical protein